MDDRARQTQLMQGTGPPTFRPTLWPAIPPGLPLVPRPELREIAPGFAEAMIEKVPSAALPPDFVLRELLELPASDGGALLDFCRDWGLLSGFGASLYDQLPALMRPPVPMGEFVALSEAHPPRPRPYVDRMLTTRALGLHAQVMQLLARHYIAHRNGDGSQALLGTWNVGGLEPPADVRGAWMQWGDLLNAALSPFRMFVDASPEQDGLWARVALPQPNLYSVMALQLASYLADDQQIQRCANERCRRYFTVQRGRAKYDGTNHKTGVRYCQHLCAKAQSERDRRRRRKPAAGKEQER